MKIVIVEPAQRASDARPVTVEARLWDALLERGRLNGFAVGTTDTTIGARDAGLLALAVRWGKKISDPREGGEGVTSSQRLAPPSWTSPRCGPRSRLSSVS